MFKKFIGLFFIAVVSTLLIFPDSKTDDNQPILHPFFTEEIVVEGEVVSKTAAVTTITAKEIAEKGKKNVAGALELIPGSHVRGCQYYNQKKQWYHRFQYEQ